MVEKYERADARNWDRFWRTELPSKVAEKITTFSSERSSVAAAAPELLALEDGYRESAESWKALLRDLKRRGMAAPAVTVGDGALGFWAAAREVWPESREQACWCHKLANVLDKLPPAFTTRAKRFPREPNL